MQIWTQLLCSEIERMNVRYSESELNELTQTFGDLHKIIYTGTKLAIPADNTRDQRSSNKGERGVNMT